MIVAVAGFYAQSLDLYFRLDDFTFLERSRFVSFGDVFEAFSVERSRYGMLDKNHAYRPISTNLYFGALQFLFGLQPLYYHLSNLSILGLNALLLQRLLVKLGTRVEVATAAALVYSLSLANFDTQLWLSVCQDLLLVSFALSCISVHIAWANRSRTGLYLSALALWMAALLSKETAIALPLVLAGYQILVVGDRALRTLRVLAPYVAIAAIYLVWRAFYFDFPDEGPYALQVGSDAAHNLIRYISWSVEAVWVFAGDVLAAGVVLATLLSIRWLPKRRRRLVALGLIWFLAFLVPVVFMRDRAYRFYLALPGIGSMIVWSALIDELVQRVERRWIASAVGVALVIISCGFSYIGFSDDVRRASATDREISTVVASVQQACPEPADASDFYFVLPREYPARMLLWGSGAVFRAIYANPSLTARKIKRREARELEDPQSTQRSYLAGRRSVFFQWTRDGRLVDLTPDWLPMSQRACGEAA